MKQNFTPYLTQPLTISPYRHIIGINVIAPGDPFNGFQNDPRMIKGKDVDEPIFRPVAPLLPLSTGHQVPPHLEGVKLTSKFQIGVGRKFPVVISELRDVIEASRNF